MRVFWRVICILAEKQAFKKFCSLLFECSTFTVLYVTTCRFLAEEEGNWAGGRACRACEVLWSANRLSVSLCKRLAHRFWIENFTGQKLTNGLYIEVYFAIWLSAFRVYSWVVRSVTSPASYVTESWIHGAYCERILCLVVYITGASQSSESLHLHLSTAEQPPTTQSIHFACKSDITAHSSFLNIIIP